MDRDVGASESHRLPGPIDRAVLIRIRDLVVDSEPLGTATLDDFLDPRLLEVQFEDGLADADSTRFDIRWTTHDDYAFHYTDSAGVDLRWDSHPHDGDYTQVTEFAHFHPPPNASADFDVVADSCIRHTTALLVTQVVLKLWRTAYHEGSVEAIKAGENPP